MEKEIKALDCVLKFSSKWTRSVLTNEKFCEEEWADVRMACDDLTACGLYVFDTNCSHLDLVKQILDFVDAGLRMG